MGITKTDLYQKRHNEMASFLKAIAHPARLAILESIAATTGCVCGDLVTELGLAQSTISQHLKALKDVGVIKGDISKKSPCYCIDEVVMKKYRVLFESICTKINCC